jgi:L-asparaginase II
MRCLRSHLRADRGIQYFVMLRVIQTRGSCVESIHPASVVAVRDNRVVWSVGEDIRTTFRSASKPFQLACSLEALGDPSLPSDELAVGAASHSAETVHVEIVRRILQRFGASEAGLLCGAHGPMHVPSAEAVIRANQAYSSVHNNCSGKHAFMLAASQKNVWHDDYRTTDHPLQRTIAARLAHWMEYTPAVVVDGCGVPTFAQPLSRVATAWSHVAHAMASPSSEPWQRRLGMIGNAMATHPELTSGTGRLDLDVVRASSEPMAVKIGAMGLFCIALPSQSLGVAMKVHTGSTEALAPLIAWVLSHITPNTWHKPTSWELLTVRNVVGREVGGWSMADGLTISYSQ